jgi:cobalt-zinc-cadmium efflux system outer membrane protein
MRRLLWPLGLAAALSSPLVVQAQPETLLSLATAITLAEAYSPGVSAARHEVEAGEGDLRQAGLLPNPELEVLVEDARRATRTTTTQLNIPLELGGKRAARVTEAERANDLARATLTGAQAELRAQVMAAFFGVLAQQERVKLATGSAELATRAAEATARKVTAGKISPVDETRSRVEQANAALELADAQAELQTARQMLASFWGAAELPYAQVEGDIDTLPARPDLALLLADIDAAPAITTSRLEFERRKAGIEVERSKQYPDVVLNVGAKRSNETEFGRSRQITQAVIGVTVPLPFFDRNQGRLQAAHSRAAKAEDEHHAVRIRLAGEVRQAASQLAQARASAQALKTTILPAAQQAYEAATRGFDAGKFGFLDVLDAQRSLLQARARYVGIVTGAWQAATTLDRLLGRALNERTANALTANGQAAK